MRVHAIVRPAQVRAFSGLARPATSTGLFPSRSQTALRCASLPGSRLSALPLRSSQIIPSRLKQWHQIRNASAAATASLYVFFCSTFDCRQNANM